MGLSVGVAVGWGLGQLAGQSTAQADFISDAPQGIKMAGQSYLNMPGTLGATGISNTAKYDNVALSSKRLPMDVVQISALGTHNSGGAVWSQTPSFDLYKDQKFSMWVYASAGITDSPGEGLAFVLQKDSNNEFSGTGESLGVWGVDPVSKTGSTDAIAKTAIPNSWAMEFDTRLNQDDPTTKWKADDLLLTSWKPADQAPSAFDVGKGTGYGNGTGNTPGESLSAEHISSGYPADPSTYNAETAYGKSSGQILRDKYYYYTQNQYGLIEDKNFPLSDQTWHHVTLKYTAPASGSHEGTMSYYYDDQNSKNSSNDYVTEPVDTTKLGATSTDSRVFWGITGSTGQGTNGNSDNDDTENSAVVFEHVPGKADGSATAKLTDETTGGTAVNAGDKLTGGDKVKLTYTVSCDSGDVDWPNVEAQLHIPTGIQVTAGTLTPQDGGAAKRLDMSQVQGKADTGQTIDENIGTLSSQAKTATLTLTGQVSNDKAYSAADTTSNFVGDGTMASATVNRFSVTQVPLLLELDQSEIHVNAGGTATLSGKVTGDISANSNLMIYAYWNKGAGTVNTFENPVSLSDQNPASGFSIPLPRLVTTAAGKYTLSVYVHDGGNANMTKTVTIPLVVGNVAFGTSSGAMTYKAAISGEPQLVPLSDPNWQFNIDDTVTDGTEWKLYAKATSLTSETQPGTTLDGGLIYKQGLNEQPLSPSADTLITDHRSDGSTDPVNIASDWGDDSGIMLKVNGGATLGDYEGRVTWTLENVQ